MYHLNFVRKILFFFILKLLLEIILRLKAKEVESYINEIFRSIIALIVDPSCSACGRDNAIDLCLKYFDNATGCGWTSRFVILGNF
jgi:hypothetical protein